MRDVHVHWAADLFPSPLPFEYNANLGQQEPQEEKKREDKLLHKIQPARRRLRRRQPCGCTAEVSH
jgi:hypothetical protein